MLTRIIAGLLGVVHGATGVWMVIAPAPWFIATPAAAATGPFNPHFVMDVGFAFLACGLGFLVFAWLPKLKLFALGATLFAVFHALFHLAGLLDGHAEHAPSDIVLAAMGFVGLAICWPRRGDVP